MTLNTHHAEALNYYWKDKTKIEQLIKTLDYKELSSRQQVIITHVEKLTRQPDNITEKDITKLKKQLNNDTELLEITLITSYFNFVNRMALGLNVTFSDDEINGYNY